jgi:hypothetical protein
MVDWLRSAPSHHSAPPSTDVNDNNNSTVYIHIHTTIQMHSTLLMHNTLLSVKFLILGDLTSSNTNWQQ